MDRTVNKLLSGNTSQYIAGFIVVTGFTTMCVILIYGFISNTMIPVWIVAGFTTIITTAVYSLGIGQGVIVANGTIKETAPLFKGGKDATQKGKEQEGHTTEH